MSQQIINLGTADKGNGDVLRTAFTKVNENFAELYNSVSAVVVASATAPAGPGAGDLWWNSEDGRMYIYYGTAWVDASPVDGAGINSTNELVNGNKTVSLDPNGLTTFPTFQTGTESLYLQGTEFGSVNSGVAIAAKNQIILAANVLGNQKNWNFGTEGKLTLPAGTTYEYLSVPLTGHGDGLAVLDFALVTDGVDAQWIASSPNPEGVGYSVGDTFTFDEEFLGIPGASTTIEVLTIGPGGSIVELGFSQPPLYPADIYRDSPINLQVGAESNRWTFGANGTLTLPGGQSIGGDSTQGIAMTTDRGTILFGNIPEVGPTGSSHFHIMKDSAFTDLFFGDDYNYVKLPQSGTWGVEIGAQGSVWRFGTDGELTLPDATVQTTAYVAPTTTGNAVISSQDSITISRNGMTIKITAAGVVQMSFDSVIDIRGRSSINNAGSTTIATPNGDTVIGTWYDISTALALGDQLVSTIMDSSFHNVYRITVLIREQDTTPGVEFTTAYAIIEQIQ